MNVKNKNILLTIVTIFIGLLFIGGTYAYLTVVANVTNATYNAMSGCFDIHYYNGGAITGTLYQTINSDGGLSGYLSMDIYVTCSSTKGEGTIYLNVSDATNSKLFENGALKYEVYQGDSMVSNGTIDRKGDIPLYDNFALNV